MENLFKHPAFADAVEAVVNRLWAEQIKRKPGGLTGTGRALRELTYLGYLPAKGVNENRELWVRGLRDVSKRITKKECNMPSRLRELTKQIILEAGAKAVAGVNKKSIRIASQSPA